MIHYSQSPVEENKGHKQELLLLLLLLPSYRQMSISLRVHIVHSEVRSNAR